jgi:hypothetical protein
LAWEDEGTVPAQAPAAAVQPPAGTGRRQGPRLASASPIRRTSAIEPIDEEPASAEFVNEPEYAGRQATHEVCTPPAAPTTSTWRVKSRQS